MKNGMQLLTGIILLLMYFIATTGCDPNAFTQHVDIPESQTVEVVDTGDSIIMGSFNIEIFGRAKMGNSDVTAILVDIARRFDLLAIQELRSTDQSIVPRFVDMINADGSKFKWVLGPRQGYTISKEQYVYIYDSEKIELVGEPYVAPDPTGVMHRSPLSASFRCIAPGRDAFSFTLMNVHVDPDEVYREADALSVVIDNVRRLHPEEDDLILLGDVNCPPRFFQDYPWFQNQFPCVADEWTTNTAQNQNLDNIVFDFQNTREFLEQSGVLNLMLEYELTRDQANLVSDHFPVWAVFSNVEAPQRSIVQEPTGVLR